MDANYVLSPGERDRIVGILREHLLDTDDVEKDGASSSRDTTSILSPSNRSYHDVGTQA